MEYNKISHTKMDTHMRIWKITNAFKIPKIVTGQK